MQPTQQAWLTVRVSVKPPRAAGVPLWGAEAGAWGRGSGTLGRLLPAPAHCVRRSPVCPEGQVTPRVPRQQGAATAPPMLVSDPASGVSLGLDPAHPGVWPASLTLLLACLHGDTPACRMAGPAISLPAPGDLLGVGARTRGLAFAARAGIPCALQLRGLLGP